MTKMKGEEVGRDNDDGIWSPGARGWGVSVLSHTDQCTYHCLSVSAAVLGIFHFISPTLTHIISLAAQTS